MSASNHPDLRFSKFPKRDGKPGVTVQRERRTKAVARKSTETKEMLKVRREDGYCRWPGCDCRRLNLRTEVCHKQHRGMGGNPAGDRTDLKLMILFCFEKHDELDAKNIDVKALDKTLGLRGPCAFYQKDGKAMVLVGRETAPHIMERSR